jgi:predicted metal-binding membrane protein
MISTTPTAIARAADDKPGNEQQRFIAGYGVGWVAYGLAAYRLDALVRELSPTWMALMTLLMFAEKILPNGQQLAIPIAVFLVAMGVWIAVSPETAPFKKIRG